MIFTPIGKFSKPDVQMMNVKHLQASNTQI